jgi:hypothetical protein
VGGHAASTDMDSAWLENFVVLENFVKFENFVTL